MGGPGSDEYSINVGGLRVKTLESIIVFLLNECPTHLYTFMAFQST